MGEEKTVIIAIRQPPHGTLFPCEGLRMGVALSGDMDPTTIVLERGVYAFLKDVDRTMYDEHCKFLKEIDLPIYIDKAAMDQYGIQAEDLMDGVEIKSHADILEMMRSVSVVIPF